MAKEKAKAAFYWAASCGGCEVSMLEIGMKILDVVEHIEIAFWPCIADFKYDDVREMETDEIDVCFFNGAIRNEENLEIARLLRDKSKIMIAYGACSYTGGIPSLANFYSREELLDLNYQEQPSVNNPDDVRPQVETKVDQGELELPDMFEEVYKLEDVVEVDYSVPGCPAVPESTMEALNAIVEGELPEKGSVIGAQRKSVCDECDRERREELLEEFYRPQEIEPDPDECLLDQGIVCMGPATRAGCGAQCPEANQPCRGCYGPTEDVEDQGLKMLSVLSSVIDAEEREEAERIIDQIADPAGTFYRFGTSDSILTRGLREQ